MEGIGTGEVVAVRGQWWCDGCGGVQDEVA